MHVPGYEQKQKDDARRARKSARSQMRDHRKRVRADNKKWADEIAPAQLTECAGGAAGFVIGGAVAIWLARQSQNFNDVLPIWFAVLIAMGCALMGGGMGAWMTDKMRGRYGVHLANKLDDGKKLNRVDQYALTRLFDDVAMSHLATEKDALFSQLCAGNLRHISYDAAGAIMKGHLRKAPGDYDVLMSVFSKESVPKDIRFLYHNNVARMK